MRSYVQFCEQQTCWSRLTHAGFLVWGLGAGSPVQVGAGVLVMGGSLASCGGLWCQMLMEVLALLNVRGGHVTAMGDHGS